MPSLNRIELIGRLGKDPELKTTLGNRHVCTFSLAVGKRWKDKKGEVQTLTDWFNIEAWGRIGDISQQYLHKGQLVYVEGRMKTDKYEQKGETRFFTKVVMTGMQMLERHETDEEGDATISVTEVSEEETVE
jgi:single-strand DNA-binding protein